jgi:hypothetical protein
MTLRSKDGKAPKVARLELGRETVRELAESEAEAAGGQVYKPTRWTQFCFVSNGTPCGWSWVRGCTAKCASSL